MDFILSLLLWALCSFSCYKIAEINHRNTTIAAILGFIFGIIAIVVYLIIGKPKNDQATHN